MAKKNILAIIDDLIEDVKFEAQDYLEDIPLKLKFKSVINDLERARASYRTLKDVLSMKNERVIIVDRSGKVQFATNEQLIKLAIMKGDIEQYGTQYVNQQCNREPRDGEESGPTTNEKRTVYDLRSVPVLRRAIDNRLP